MNGFIYPSATPYTSWEPDLSTARGEATTLRLTEPLLSTIDPDNIVTINNFGAQVLNSRNLFIADVDLRRLDASSESPTLATAIQAATNVAKREKVGLRIYETGGGLRVVCSSKPMGMSEYAARVMKRLKTDPRYVALCETTHTYRARLSPKPFARTPPGLHCAVCRYVETVGSTKIHRDLAAAVEFHDIATKAMSGVRSLV